MHPRHLIPTPHPPLFSWLAGLLIACAAQAFAAEAAGRTVVTLPADFDWAPLLTVVRTGPGAYQVDKDAEQLRKAVCANLVITPCYVDPIAGSDANNGSTKALAVKTMQAAAGKSAGDITEIIVIPPPSRIIWGASATVNGFAHSTIIRPLDNQPIVFCKAAKPVWTAVGATAFTTPGPTGPENTSIVMDWSSAARAQAPDGGGLGYERVEDAAAVAGKPGTFHHDAATGLVTVHPIDGRSLVGDEYMTCPALNDTNCQSMQTPAKATAPRIYIATGCNWIGGLNALGMNNNSEASVRTVYVFDHCGWWTSSLKGNAMSSVGPNDIYTFDCIGGYSGEDLWNNHGNGHGSTHMFHVRPRCTVRNGYGNTGRDNVDTGHEDCRGITVMPIYANSDGRVYGWIDRSHAIAFGGRVGPSLRTAEFSASVNSGGTSIVDLYEVELVPSKGPFTLTADGTKGGNGARIRCHGMDITQATTRGTVNVTTP